jgi:hypothetical protein
MHFIGNERDGFAWIRTIDDLFLNIDIADLEPILPSIFQHLIKSKLFQLHPELIPNGTYSFCLDGHVSHTYHDKSQHPCQGCPYCLKRTREEKTWYVHCELVLTFIAPSGFQIPILIHRIKGNPEWGKLSENKLKQECERTAFPEIVQKLRKLFPRLKMHLLLDSLYATDPVFTLLNELHIGYSIVKKLKVLKSVGSDCEGLKILSEPIPSISEGHRFNIHQIFRIFNDIPYKEHKLSIIQLDEYATKKPSKRFAKVLSKSSHWEWISSEYLTRGNVVKQSSQCRLRWGEEDFFNTAENRGFNMNHDFSRAPHSQTIWFYLILIAMALSAILEHSSLNLIFKKNTIRHVMEEMLRDLIYLTYPLLFESTFPTQLRWRPP